MRKRHKWVLKMFRFSLVFLIIFATGQTQNIRFPFRSEFGRHFQSVSSRVIFPGPSFRPDVQYGRYVPTTTTTGPESNPEADYYDYREEERSAPCVLTSSPPDPGSNCCGIDVSSQDRIVGGAIADIYQYPWVVQIEYMKLDGAFERPCGGFLISGRYVLTAAHCFEENILKKTKPINVIVGEYNIRNEGPDCIRTPTGNNVCTDGAEKVPIEEYIVHPKFLDLNVSMYNDIALVRMKRTVQYTTYVRPICLPTSDVTINPNQNLRFDVAGWGANSNWKELVQGRTRLRYSNEGIKHYVNVPYVDREKCSQTYPFLTEGYICAGGEKGKDSCKGDSGSPLMYQKNSIYEVVGLVSTALEKYLCGKEDRPALYTKVYQYLTWIKGNIRP